MAESAQIQSMSTMHESIIAFLIANPHMKKGDVARHFQVTPAWLSTIIHSDIFQAKLAERQDEFFSATTVPIKEKLENLADMAIDRLTETIETETDPHNIREAARLALDRIGHGTTPVPGAGVTLNLNLTSDQLALYREKIINKHNGEVYEQGPEALSSPTTQELQTSGGD